MISLQKTTNQVGVQGDNRGYIKHNHNGNYPDQETEYKDI